MILDYILGGGLVSAAVAIMSLRSTARKAKAEAEKAEAEAERSRADAETVRLDNSEHATRILLDNLMKPLIETLHETKTELDLTKRELARNTREMARFRKALERVGDCDYREQCPVLDELRKQPKAGGDRADDGSRGGQHSCGGADCKRGIGADERCEHGDKHGQRAGLASGGELQREERARQRKGEPR